MILGFSNVPGEGGSVNPERGLKSGVPAPPEGGPDPAEWTAAAVPALGPRVWAVLGGGGTKGLAHVGAWQALAEARVPVAGIVGTSIGALVGALVAGGLGWEAMVPLALALRKGDIARVDRRALLVNGIRRESLFQGEPLRRYIARLLPVARWEDLRVPLQVNAVDLETGRTVWFGTGADTSVPLAEAVYASAALPVFYPPARLGGRVLVDGGAGDSLPLGRAAELGATGVIGVDAGAGRDSPVGPVLAQGMLAVHQRVFSMMAWRRRAETVEGWAGPPLVHVRPRLDGYSTFDFANTRYFLEEGYRATRAALAG